MDSTPSLQPIHTWGRGFWAAAAMTAAARNWLWLRQEEDAAPGASALKEMVRPPIAAARVLFGLPFSMLLLNLPALAATQATASTSSVDLQAAKSIFDANCARCHGTTGAGDGLDAQRMHPRPRKLSEGVFKFRTTASGTPPTDQDLFHTLSTGLPGSRMPDFQRLPEETRWELVAYVKSLSSVFQEQKPEPVDMGRDPGPQKADLAKGKHVYAQLGCAACHGEQGRGNGPSAATLVDNWNDPTRPADLTYGWSYRGGSSPREIVARMMAGIDGTPMPSYADAVQSKEDVWHMAYYVQSLQETPNFGRQIEARKFHGPVPTTPDDPDWDSAPRTDVRLASNFYQNGQVVPTTAAAISVQAVYNEKEFLVRLSWHDPSETRTSPPDAVTVAVLADRRRKFEVGSLRSVPADPKVPALDLAGWVAHSAEVPETDSSYSEGRWTALIKVPVQESILGNMASKPILIGFLVWDGGNGEQGRHRASSNWIDLVKQEEVAAS